MNYEKRITLLCKFIIFLMYSLGIPNFSIKFCKITVTLPLRIKHNNEVEPKRAPLEISQQTRGYL